MESTTKANPNSPAESTPKKRFNLDLTAQARTKLEKLLVISDATSYSEVIRRALSLYEKILAIYQDNGQIILRHKDGKEYLLTLES